MGNISATPPWSHLAVHDEGCKKHRPAEDTSVHSNWRELVWYLEDKKPQNWKQLLNSVKQVPIGTQQNFFEYYRGFGSYRWVREGLPDATLKNFAIPYIVEGVPMLLTGQFYRHIVTDTLLSFAEGIRREEFIEAFSAQLVVSVDILKKEPISIRLIP